MSTPVGISGSRSSAILGVSPYRTNLDIWLQIKGKEFCIEKGYKYPEFDGNTATRFGSAFESGIIKVVEKVKNIKIKDQEKYFEDGYLTCHCDGLAILDGEQILIENKTTTASSFYSEWGEEGTNRIPLTYQVQVQHNLYLTKLNKCLLPLLVFPKRQTEFEESGIGIENNFSMIDIERWVETLYEMGYLKFYIIERDDDLIKLMLDKYQTFWNENIIGGKMPDVCNIEDIKLIYTDPKGTVIASEQVERWNEERKLLMQEKKELEKRIDELKTLELEYLRTAEGKIIDDDTRDKTFLLSRSGKKLAQYDGKTFR